MCLILFSYKEHSKYRLILASNRDEFLDRPTTKLSYIQQYKIFAGLDNKDGGTWLGLSKTGKIAGITNFRDPKIVLNNPPSRGHLVSGYLKSDYLPEDYLKSIQKQKTVYNGFNLIVGDTENLFYYSNVSNKIVKIQAGLYGLSNHFLDTLWPKVINGKKILKSILTENKKIQFEKIFSLLKNKETVSDELLPNTGVGLQWEQLLSTIFITTPIYGTRTSSIILIEYNGKTTFIERTFHYSNGKIIDEETENISFTNKI